MTIFEEVRKNLSVDERREVKAIFDKLMSSQSIDQLKPSLSLVKRKLERMERSDDKYQRSLVAITKTITSEVIIKKGVDFKSRYLALVAVSYLCDPYDVIPDIDPEHGYKDDVYMFSLVLAELKKLKPKLHETLAQAYLRALKD